MKIAYIGTFNPPTTGHLLIAETASNLTDNTGVIFIPVSDYYNKDGLNTKFALREEMLKLSIQDNSKFSMSDVEQEFAKKMERQPATVETLFALKCQYKEDIALLIGSDNYIDFHNWHDAETILQNFKVIVYPRGAVCDPKVCPLYETYKDNIIILDTNLITNISSTMVRENFKKGVSNKYLIKGSVERFINTYYYCLNYHKEGVK